MESEAYARWKETGKLGFSEFGTKASILKDVLNIGRYFLGQGTGKLILHSCKQPHAPVSLVGPTHVHAGHVQCSREIGDTFCQALCSTSVTSTNLDAY